MAFQVKSFKELISMTKEKLDEAMVPLRVRAAKAKAEGEKVKLEQKLLELETKINEKCAQKELDFSAIADMMDDYDLTERRLRQIENLVNQLFPILPYGRTTVCQLILENGFSVNGHSSCVDISNFNKELGEKIAYQNAFDKIWELEGYLLKEGLWINDTCAEVRDIGWAIHQLEQGKRVARDGWNGKGMWLSLSGPQPYRSIPAESFWSKNNADYAASTIDGHANVLPCITMKTATGEILMGWLASQTDLLAKDWVVV